MVEKDWILEREVEDWIVKAWHEVKAEKVKDVTLQEEVEKVKDVTVTLQEEVEKVKDVTPQEEVEDEMVEKVKAVVYYSVWVAELWAVDVVEFVPGQI